MKCTRGENGKNQTQCMIPGYFQITQEENSFHIIFLLKSTLIGKKRRISLENQSSLHSTVHIDDKNNCRPSSSKSKTKPIVLDNSEQDLDSSYRDTQDSNTEDASSTNESASEQNLLISKS